MAESAIKVAVRLRPSLHEENVLEKEMINLNEKDGTLEIRNTLFSFDHIFNPSVSNQDVYEALVSDKIKRLFEGFNCSILAYGATGSGKTYTMGTASKVQGPQNGLIPLALKDIFKYAHSIDHETDVLIKASFFEIYMENIKDLLKTEALFVPGDSKEAKITNMTEITVKSFEEAMYTLGKGIQYRTTGFTAKNSKSSRSHAFFTIKLIMTDKKNGGTINSKFQLVDLAGSERAGVDTTGKEFKQGIQINKGLTALGRVISSLSTKEKHIPYRDSLLTRYLQDSFGGNSYTVMLTCISPARANVEETLSSLRYSYFAKKIKNTITMNRDSADLIKHLKSELDRMKKMLVSNDKDELINKIDSLNKHLEEDGICFEKMHERVLKVSANIQYLEEKMISEESQSPPFLFYAKTLNEICKDLNTFAAELIDRKTYCLEGQVNTTKPIVSYCVTSDDSKFTELEQRIADLEKRVEVLKSEPSPIPSEEVPLLNDDTVAIHYIDKGLSLDTQANLDFYELRHIRATMTKIYENYEEPNEMQNNNERPQTVVVPMKEEFQKRISNLEHNLEFYREINRAKTELMNEETARFCLEYIYRKYTMLTSAPIPIECLDKYNLEPSAKPKLELELKKIKEEKSSQEIMHKKEILKLKCEYTTKLEGFCKKIETQNREFRELEEKIKALEEENKKLRNSRLQLPNLTTQRKGLKKQKKEPQTPNLSMMEAFLSEDEASFTQSEHLDPDYRATPLWKRNKLNSKRKAPEDDAVLTSPKPPKTLSASGCSCPSDCGTMRCSCKKKRQECCTFCECNKAKCMNTPSSENL